MKTLISILLVVCGPVAGLGAQSLALSNADVIRLVMSHVSDQTVAAVIHEARATQFDLSPRGLTELAAYSVSTPIITAMRQPSAPPSLISTVGVRTTRPAGAQTLAGAAAAMANVKHTWKPPTSTAP